MSAHTPGPWMVQSRGDLDPGRASYRVAALYLGSSTSICELTRWDGGEETLEQRANARLIAAAPDLLAALIRLVENVDGGEFISITHVQEARAAIAKATGGAA